MKMTKMVLFLFLLSFIPADHHLQGGIISKGRRYGGPDGPKMNLFPFPRVGRSDPSLAAAYAESHLSEMHSVPQVDLVPIDFKLAPWIMSGTSYGFQKRDRNVNPWFVPRLGKLQKRSSQDDNKPWTLLAINEPSFTLNDLVSRLSDLEEDNDNPGVEKDHLSDMKEDDDDTGGEKDRLSDSEDYKTTVVKKNLSEKLDNISQK